MDALNLQKVASLAREIANLADDVLAEDEKVERQKRENSHYWWRPTKNRSALRRRSMDLTRALADLRRAS